MCAGPSFGMTTTQDIGEWSLFMGGGPVQIGGGINFSASKLRGRKISVQAFRGGGKISVHIEMYRGYGDDFIIL